MKSKALGLTLIGLFASISLFAQLTVNTAVSATQLVNALVGNQGVTITNITSNCPAGSWGQFATGATPSSLGISAGIVLTTGTSANLGAAASSFSSMSHNGAGDPDLNTYGVTTVTTHDACKLEFDAIPICDTIRFRYVFASEEYPDQLGGPFYDAFAFFINGPGLPLGTNIAKIPATNTPININTVNNGQAFGCPAVLPGPCMNCAYYVNNCTSTTMVYDGKTTVLTAQAIVQACATYHIKLEIADGTDYIYDSAVFLEQGTLACTGFTFNATNSNAVEGCQDGVIHVCHQLDPSIPHTINYQIEGTATNGIDYTFLPNSITIPAGTNCADINIIAPNDGITELPEAIYFIYQPNACSPNDTVAIFILDGDSVSAGPDMTTCTGIPTTLGNAGAGGWTYNWWPAAGLNDSLLAQPTAMWTNNSAVDTVITYYLHGFSAGCSYTDSMQLTVQPGPVANAGADVTFCPGTGFPLIGSMAVPGMNYQWSPNNGALFFPNASETNVYPISSNPLPVTTNYVVQVDGGMTCMAYDTVAVTENPLPPTDLTAIGPYCMDAPIDLLIQGTPIGGTYSGTGVNAGSFDPALAGAGSANVYYSFTNIYNCTVLDSQMVTVNALPLIDAGINPTICENASANLNALASNITHWSWSPITFLSDTLINNPVVANPMPAGTYNYVITVTDNNGCVNFDNIDVIVTPLPPVYAGPDQSICIGITTPLLATGAVSYVWSPATALTNTNIDNPRANPTSTTTYVVTGTDAIGCVNLDSMVLTVNPLPPTTMLPMPDLCLDADDLPLAPYGTPAGGTYSGTGVSANIFSPSTAGTGTYSIVYTYTNPTTTCSQSANGPIIVRPLPAPAFVASPSISTLANAAIHFVDQSPDALDWNWQFGDGDSLLHIQNPTHTYNDTGTFVITLTTHNQYGCQLSDSEHVVIGPDLLFFIPTAFTPNGDGNNDVFYGGEGFGFYQFHMVIFDRWGNAIFETFDHHNGWDGNNASQGVYLYRITMTDMDHHPYEYVGNISVIR